MRSATAILLAALAGALPALLGGDAVAILVWLAMVGAALGYGCGALGVSLAAALAVPALWAVALLLAPGALSAPHWGALGAAGLFLLGQGLGARAPGRPAPGAAGLLLVCALLVGLPVKGGLGGTPWAARSPRVGALLFEASPATWLVEASGLDWMRAEGVYHAAGTDWFPLERRAVRGALAGPLLFVVGCCAALLAPRLPRRQGSGREPSRGKTEESRSS